MTDKMTPETAANLISQTLRRFADSYWVAMDTDYVPPQNEGAMHILTFVGLFKDQVCFHDILEEINDGHFNYSLSGDEQEAVSLYLDCMIDDEDAVDDEWRDKVYEIILKDVEMLTLAKWLRDNAEETIRNLERSINDLRSFINKH